MKEVGVAIGLIVITKVTVTFVVPDGTWIIVFCARSVGPAFTTLSG